jgi:adenine deaminase
MNIQETWIKGKNVFADGKVLFRYKEKSPVNNLNCEPITDSDILVINKHGEIRIIVAVEGELLTSEIHGSSPESEFVTSEISNDVLKIGDLGLFDVRKFEPVPLFVQATTVGSVLGIKPPGG